MKMSTDNTDLNTLENMQKHNSGSPLVRDHNLDPSEPVETCQPDCIDMKDSETLQSSNASEQRINEGSQLYSDERDVLLTKNKATPWCDEDIINTAQQQEQEVQTGVATASIPPLPVAAHSVEIVLNSHAVDLNRSPLQEENSMDTHQLSPSSSNATEDQHRCNMESSKRIPQTCGAADIASTRSDDNSCGGYQEQMETDASIVSCQDMRDDVTNDVYLRNDASSGSSALNLSATRKGLATTLTSNRNDTAVYCEDNYDTKDQPGYDKEESVSTDVATIEFDENNCNCHEQMETEAPTATRPMLPVEIMNNTVADIRKHIESTITLQYKFEDTCPPMNNDSHSNTEFASAVMIRSAADLDSVICNLNVDDLHSEEVRTKLISDSLLKHTTMDVSYDNIQTPPNSPCDHVSVQVAQCEETLATKTCDMPFNNGINKDNCIDLESGEECKESASHKTYAPSATAVLEECTLSYPVAALLWDQAGTEDSKMLIQNVEPGLQSQSSMRVGQDSVNNTDEYIKKKKVPTATLR